jgi:hypothetical protein
MDACVDDLTTRGFAAGARVWQNRFFRLPGNQAHA